MKSRSKIVKELRNDSVKLILLQFYLVIFSSLQTGCDWCLQRPNYDLTQKLF